MSIKNLQEISSLVTNYTKKNRFVELSEGSGEAKYLQLLKGLESKSFQSDEEAIQGIYGKSLGDKTFAMLKTRAKERLINMIFQLDTQKRFKSSYDKAYFLTCKNLLAGALLLNQNRPNAATEALNIALSYATKYHFTDFSITALRLLRYSISFTGSSIKHKKYSEELKQNQKILDAE